MKRTFRFLAMGLLAVGLLASCNKKENNNSGTADGMGFKAMTEKGGSNSKTHGVLQNDGTNEWLEVQWSDNDRILVDNGAGALTFGLTSGVNTTTGEFHVTNGSSFDFTSGDFFAIYPATNAENVDNAVNGAEATFNLPATQVFSTEHPSSFAEKALPMVAHSTNQNLQFKNVLGGVCFPLVGQGYTVTRIELKSNADEALWGTCTTTIDADGYPTNTAVSNNDSNKNVITIDCGNGIALNATSAIEFTVMVPPTTLASGFSITMYNGATVLDEMSTTANPNIMRGAISVVDSDLNVVYIPSGAYSIDPNNRVYFAPGNLKYTISSNEWAFIDHQYDIIEPLGMDVGDDYADQGVVTSFGWGTSGYDNTANDPDAMYFQPYCTSWIADSGTPVSEYNFYGYGPSINMGNPDIAGSNYDWGLNQAIYNPATGNTDAAGTWRTLTSEEMSYLMFTRDASTVNGTANARFAKATVNGYGGVILFPDRYKHPASVTAPVNINDMVVDYTDNNYDVNSWTAMEDAGCIFLIANGWRGGKEIKGVGTIGNYWTSTHYDYHDSWGFNFTVDTVAVYNDRYRYNGFAVRLARPVD